MRVVFLVSGRLEEHHRVLIKAIQARGPQFEVAGLVIESPPFSWRAFPRLLSTRGFGKTISTLLSRARTALMAGLQWASLRILLGWTRAHGSSSGLSLRTEHTPSFQSDDARKAIASFNSDLGLIFRHERIDSDIRIRLSRGSLEVCHTDRRHYSCGGIAGYPELLHGDSHLGVSIIWRKSNGLTRKLVGYREVAIQEFDTFESLKIKSDVCGVNLLLETLEMGRFDDDGVGESVVGTRFEPMSDDKTEKIINGIQARRFTFLNQGTARRASNNTVPLLYSRIYRLVAALATSALARKKKSQLEAQGRAPIVILYYHGVGNGLECGLTIPIEMFHRHVLFLRKYFEVISMQDALSRLNAGNNNRVAAVLTFDDGYKSNFDELLPYLEFYNVPATFFVCADSCDGPVTLPHDIRMGFPEAKTGGLDDLLKTCGTVVEIGCHGNLHESADQLNASELSHFLGGSRAKLENSLGMPVKWFAFPYGTRKVLTDNAVSLAQSTYDAAFSAYGGYNHPGASEGNLFRRINCPGYSDVGMALIMMGHNGTKFYDPMYRNQIGKRAELTP